MLSPTFRLASLCAVSAALWASEAEASGFMIRENSAESLSMAFAGNASRADDAATVFNNPAGMSWLEGSQAEMGGVLILPSIHFQGSANALSTPISGSNGRNAGQIAMVPHMYGIWDFGNGIKGGLAITVPFGNTVDYSEAWSGRYTNLKTAAIAIDINPNVSYRVSNRLSLGAGFSAQYFKATLTAAIPQFLIFSAPVPDGYYKLTGDSWGFGFNLGALAEPIDGTRIGVTYRSSVQHNVSGELTFPGTNPLLGLVDGAARTKIELPASTTGSITQQIGTAFSLSADVQWTQWSSFRNVVVTSANPTISLPRHYRDSFMASFGGAYRVNERWTLRAGLGWDETPVRDAYRDPGVPDKDRYIVGAGVGYRIAANTTIDAAYAHYFAAGHATMNESVNSRDPFTGAIALQGRYSNHLDYFGLTVRTAM